MSRRDGAEYGCGCVLILYIAYALITSVMFISNINEIFSQLRDGVINEEASALFEVIFGFAIFNFCTAIFLVFKEYKELSILDKSLYVICFNPALIIPAIGAVICISLNVGNIKENPKYMEWMTASIFYIIAFLMLVYHLYKMNKCREEVKQAQRERNNFQAEFDNKEKKLNREYQEKKNQLISLETNIKQREDIFERTLKSQTPFKQCAQLYADYRSVLYDQIAESLLTKSHPAKTAAENVKLCKARIKELESENKELAYKYEYLTEIFPELREYFLDEEALLQIKSNGSWTSFLEDYDHARDYLQKEEWESLSRIERNKIALDRWINTPKNNWTIGMLYEMQIAHRLGEEKFTAIENFGIKNGLNDLGRDIIAKKIEGEKEDIYIIQCKNWSRIKEIHENVICQIFGTTIKYKISNPSLFVRNVYPCLITTTQVSKMAMEFAKALGVKVWVIEFNLKSFPLIKCNINNGNKIYHLPFDQKYWDTQIDREGEFFAWTVDEAENNGFRRAYKWHGSQ